MDGIKNYQLRLIDGGRMERCILQMNRWIQINAWLIGSDNRKMDGRMTTCAMDGWMEGSFR